MDAFGLVPNIIATIETIYKVIKFLEDIKSSGLDCNKYISEASSSYIILQQVQQRLHSNAAVGHTVQPWSSHLQALAGEDGVLKQYKSDMEQVVSILLQVKNYRFRRVFVWHREKGKIEDIFKKAERYKSAIQLALSHDQLSLSGHTHEVLNRVEGRIETTATAQATETAKSNKQDIIDWLCQSTVNHDNFQRDYNATAQEGTGQAFLSSDTFRKWLEGSHATIFCPGLPGAGKTVMASIVKSHLDQDTTDGNRLKAVIYFNYKRHLEDHGHRALLLAVLTQFLSWSDRVPDRLHSMHDKRRAALDTLNMDDIMLILENLILSSDRSFLIMDALDEFYDDDGARSQFLRLIKRLQTSGNLSDMLTARPHLIDDPTIGKWPDATIQITATDDDLHTYLDHKICGFPYLPDDFDLRLSIADRIVEASAGIFLLAVLHSDSLKDAYNEFEVEDIMESLSKGPDALDRAYEEATKRIDHQPANRRYYAHLTISWMVQCLRPLTPMELQHAVTKPEHLERGLTASRLVKIDTLVSFCAGLVTIDHESNVVRFVHYTTQEYFTRDRLTKWLPGADMDPARVCTTYMMNSKVSEAIERAHETQLEHVRKYQKCPVLFFGHSRQAVRREDLERISQDALADWPFLEYCKKHWASHCSEFQKPLQDLLLEFLTGPANIVYAKIERQWCMKCERSERSRGIMLAPVTSYPHIVNVNLRRVTPISICCRRGLRHLITKLLDQGSEIRVAPELERLMQNSAQETWENTRSYFDPPPPLHQVAYDEPLLLACKNEDIELASLLFARTSIRDDVYYKAFQVLDQKKNFDMLDLIIRRCPLDDIHLTEIAMCSSIDEVRIRKSLIQRTLRLPTVQYGSNFQAFFERQSASFWVEYALEHGLDIQSVFGSSPYSLRTGIEHAAAAGCLESVRILLNYPGVEVCKGDPEDEHERTTLFYWEAGDALELAAKGSHLEVFRELLDHISSKPDAADLFRCSVGRVLGYLANPTSWHPGPQSVDVVLLETLLGSQDLNHLPFARLEKAIQVAVSDVFGSDQSEIQDTILGLLLHESGIDFSRRDVHGRTLLQIAMPHALAGSLKRHEEESVFASDKYTHTLRMLLEHPSFDYNDQYNPIIAMLKELRVKALRVNIQNEEGLGVSLKLQMILKDDRFHPDTPDDTGRTALSYASEYHLDHLVKMLLQHPLVDAISRDITGRTPLSYAAGAECEQIYGSEMKSVLPTLLADDNIRERANDPDTAGITPLMYSCRLGLEEHVGLLLDIAGSEVNRADSRGRTPLLHALENSESKHEPLAVLLANPNIKVNAKDEDGRSTLFYVLKHQDPWRHEVWGVKPNISLVLQHEDLDLSEDLRNMRDDDGCGLDPDSVLRSVKVLRERNPMSQPFVLRELDPPNPTELRCLDYLESMFSAGFDQSNTDAYVGSDANRTETFSNVSVNSE